MKFSLVLKKAYHIVKKTYMAKQHATWSCSVPLHPTWHILNAISWCDTPATMAYKTHVLLCFLASMSYQLLYISNIYIQLIPTFVCVARLTLRNLSTVFDFPAVIITSFEWMCSKAWAAMLSVLKNNTYFIN